MAYEQGLIKLLTAIRNELASLPFLARYLGTNQDLYSASLDGMVRCWNPATGAELATAHLKSPATTLAADPDRPVLLAAEDNGAEAEALLRKALADRSYGGAALAQLLVALSSTLFEQGDSTESSSLCERALVLYREAYGDTHEEVAETMRGVGRINSSGGRTEVAERWLLQARETWLRLDRPMQVALTEGDLAVLYAHAGARDRCRQIGAQALSSR